MLDVSHDAWHGAYSSFKEWRHRIARAIGVNLSEMQGFTYDWNSAISWDALKPDPIHVLLNHPDCDGEIAWQDCEALADGLVEISALLPKDDEADLYYLGCTYRFIVGCRRAAIAKEDLKFR